MSADGSVIAGRANDLAFRWTQAGGLQSLGDLPGGSAASWAFDMTPDASTVVGHGTTAKGLEAFIWTEAAGIQNLADVITQNGIDLTGWQLYRATGISDNGQVIAGAGAIRTEKTKVGS